MHPVKATEAVLLGVVGVGGAVQIWVFRHGAVELVNIAGVAALGGSLARRHRSTRPAGGDKQLLGL